MSVAEVESQPQGGEPMPPARLEVGRRPLSRRVMHAVRRAHLYLGLFLLPWAVLYGATGFLFNHPTAFADAPAANFGASELAGTPMASPPTPAEVAADVVAALNDRAADGRPYALVEPEKARYTRDFAFAAAKAGGTEVNVLFDVNHPCGTVRSRPVVPPKVEERAPFAVGPAKAGGAKPAKGPAPQVRPAGGLALGEPLHERVRASVPAVLARTGFPAGDATVTSVPDLSFLMSDGAKVWRVTYNAMAGTVGGESAEAAPPPEGLSTRRFLTQLHKQHVYPGGTNAKWFWSVVVDAMAFVMVFWGVSGIFMWWQLKATRRPGLVVLLASAAAATALGFGMHDFLTPK